MKKIAHGITFLLSWASTVGFSDSLPKVLLSQGSSAERACVMVGQDLRCWSEDESEKDDVPNLKFKNPKQIAVGPDHTCVLLSDEVICWTHDHARLAVSGIPTLKKPVAVAAGPLRTCASDEEGLKCWGWLDEELRKSFEKVKFINVRQVTEGDRHTCTLDDQGVKCWGSDEFGQRTIPSTIKLKNPRSVEAGAFHTCALDEERVKCWGGQDTFQFTHNFGQTVPPPLKKPIAVSAGHVHTYAIDEEQKKTVVRCWGAMEREDRGSGKVHVNFGQTSVPPSLKNPIAVSAGLYHTCALHEGGVACWGRGWNKTRNEELNKWIAERR